MERDDDTRTRSGRLLDAERVKAHSLERPVSRGDDALAIRYISLLNWPELAGELAGLRDSGEQVRRLPPAERHERTEHLTAVMVALSLSPEMALLVTGKRTARFEELEPDEKLCMLCIAEERLAAFEGREPCRIGCFVGGKGEAAFLRTVPAIVFNVMSALDVATPVEALMQMFFHESTHRLQWAAAQNPGAFPHLSESLIGGWIDNFRPMCYSDSGALASERFAYSSQPVERHAVERARQLMKRVYEYFGVQHA